MPRLYCRDRFRHRRIDTGHSCIANVTIRTRMIFLRLWFYYDIFFRTMDWLPRRSHILDRACYFLWCNSSFDFRFLLSPLKDFAGTSIAWIQLTIVSLVSSAAMSFISSRGCSSHSAISGFCSMDRMRFSTSKFHRDTYFAICDDSRSKIYIRSCYIN